MHSIVCISDTKLIWKLLMRNLPVSDPAIGCSAIAMVSLNHEGLIKLVCDRPAFAADLHADLLAVKVPSFSKARLVDVTLNQVRPAEYRADAVVLFTR